MRKWAKTNMTDHQELIEKIPAYALGVLDETERQLVLSHLSSCQLCQQELASYEETATELASTLASEEPPARLKARLMERIQPAGQASLHQQPSFTDRLLSALQGLPPAWAPISVILLLVLLVSNALLWRQANLPSNHEFKTVTLTGTDFAPEAHGIMVLTPDDEQGVLVVNDLTPLSDQEQYQLWLIDDAGNRDSGAIFSVNSVGRAQVEISGEQPLPNYAAFGITIEPAGGSSGPTGQQVLGSEL